MPKTHCAAPELASLLDGSSAGELIPELARRGLQQLIELEVAAVLGADRHERTDERLGYRNGYRPRTLTTQVGDLDLLIPKLRSGSFLPSILEPRRRVDQALYAVIIEAYIGGVSTRKVDSLASALGSQSGISKSQVSRICQDIDQQVQSFLSRPLESCTYAYLYLDATYIKGRRTVEGVTHDYIRHGTTTLFAALDVATCEVITRCKPRHRHQEFLGFLRQIEKSVPEDLDIQLIVDNYCTHKHAKVRAWLAQRPRFHVHYNPTYASWLNQVERWFGIITQRAIRRGSFSSVKVLIAKIEQFVAAYNKTKAPFNWTATADSILEKLQRLCSQISGTAH